MAKKQFTNSFQELFTPTEQHVSKQNAIEAIEQVDEFVQRTTLLLNRNTYETVKAIAHWERKQIKEIIQEALLEYISKMDSQDIEKAINHYSKKSLGIKHP